MSLVDASVLPMEEREPNTGRAELPPRKWVGLKYQYELESSGHGRV